MADVLPISGGSISGMPLSAADSTFIQAFPGPDMIAKGAQVASMATRPFQTQYKTAALFDPAIDPGQPFIVGYWATRLGARNARLQYEMGQRASSMDPGKLLEAVTRLRQSNASIMRAMAQLDRTAKEQVGRRASDDNRLRLEGLKAEAKIKTNHLEQINDWKMQEEELKSEYWTELMEGKKEKEAAAHMANADQTILNNEMSQLVYSLPTSEVHTSKDLQGWMRQLQGARHALAGEGANQALRERAMTLQIYESLVAETEKASGNLKGHLEKIRKQWAEQEMARGDVEGFRAQFGVDSQKEIEALAVKLAASESGPSRKGADDATKELWSSVDKAIEAGETTLQPETVAQSDAVPATDSVVLNETDGSGLISGLDTISEPGTPSVAETPAEKYVPKSAQQEGYAEIARNNELIDQLIERYKASASSVQPGSTVGAPRVSDKRNLLFGPSHTYKREGTRGPFGRRRATAIVNAMGNLSPEKQAQLMWAFIEAKGDPKLAAQILGGPDVAQVINEGVLGSLSDDLQNAEGDPEETKRLIAEGNKAAEELARRARLADADPSPTPAAAETPADADADADPAAAAASPPTTPQFIDLGEQTFPDADAAAAAAETPAPDAAAAAAAAAAADAAAAAAAADAAAAAAAAAALERQRLLEQKRQRDVVMEAHNLGAAGLTDTERDMNARVLAHDAAENAPDLLEENFFGDGDTDWNPIAVLPVNQIQNLKAAWTTMSPEEKAMNAQKMREEIANITVGAPGDAPGVPYDEWVPFIKEVDATLYGQLSGAE
mgnify:CR=1 FL=1